MNNGFLLKKGRQKITFSLMKGKLFLHLILLLTSFVVLFPLFIMLSAAFKNEVEIFSYPITLIPKKIIFDNFKRLVNSFPLYTINSIKVTLIIVVIQIITATSGAYAFSKLHWKGRDLLFLLYVSSIMIPAQIPIIPQFILMRNLGLYNTHLALVLLGSFTAFGTFLIKQYFMTIPDAFLEAARIDGASEFFIFIKIMLPLAKPALATQIIFSFRYFWNDFFVPMIYISENRLKTIPLGMTDFTTEYYTYYGPQMAACLVSTIPVMIIFFAAQKYFVEGIAASGLKG